MQVRRCAESRTLRVAFSAEPATEAAFGFASKIFVDSPT